MRKHCPRGGGRRGLGGPRSGKIRPGLRIPLLFSKASPPCIPFLLQWGAWQAVTCRDLAARVGRVSSELGACRPISCPLGKCFSRRRPSTEPCAPSRRTPGGEPRRRRFRMLLRGTLNSPQEDSRQRRTARKTRHIHAVMGWVIRSSKQPARIQGAGPGGRSGLGRWPGDFRRGFAVDAVVEGEGNTAGTGGGMERRGQMINGALDGKSAPFG